MANPETTRNQVGLPLGGALPGSKDNGGPGVPVTGKPVEKSRLWGLAETADWNGWPPKFFWRWLLQKLDRSHGYDLDYK